jgi:hypothetical protein
MIYYCFGPEVGLFFLPAMSAYHIVEDFTYPYVVLRNAVDPEWFFSDPSSDPDLSFRIRIRIRIQILFRIQYKFFLILK